MTQDVEILTPKEVGRLLKLKPETVRQLMRTGLLPASKIGGSWRTSKDAICGYLEDKMGLASRIHAGRRKKPSKGVFQVQRRSKTVGKGRKISSNGKPEEIFFSR